MFKTMRRQFENSPCSPNNTSCRAPSCKLSFQHPFPMLNWSNACWTQQQSRGSSCNGVSPMAAMQFQRATHCARPQGVSVDGDDDG